MIDSHAHLTDARFAGEVDEIVLRARQAGIQAVVSIATTVEDSMAAADLAARIPEVFATAGIHPHSAEQATDEAFFAIEELAGRPRVVALGETGLDYHYDNAPKPVQRQAFVRHLALAARLDLPVVVHAREADDDVRDLIRDAGAGTRGVLHCFSSGPELMETALELGWYVSFAGMITFAKYTASDLLRAVPRDRLLVETDSPYLAPVPFRGKRNEPAYVAEVLRRAADLRGDDPVDLAAATTANARSLYRLDAARAASASRD